MTNCKGLDRNFTMFLQPKSFRMGGGVPVILDRKTRITISIRFRAKLCFLIEDRGGGGGGDLSYPKKFRLKKPCEILIQSLSK